MVTKQEETRVCKLDKVSKTKAEISTRNIEKWEGVFRFVLFLFLFFVLLLFFAGHRDSALQNIFARPGSCSSRSAIPVKTFAYFCTIATTHSLRFAYSRVKKERLFVVLLSKLGYKLKFVQVLQFRDPIDLSKLHSLKHTHSLLRAVLKLSVETYFAITLILPLLPLCPSGISDLSNEFFSLFFVAWNG